MKRLSDLLRRVPAQLVCGSLEVSVGNVVADSRQIQPGDVYVCLPGYKSEGGELRADRHEFIPMALERGAKALVVDRPVLVDAPITVVRVADCWSALAAMASELLGQPSQSLTIVGVTGTSGKTSTTYFVEAVLKGAGRRPARFGTIEYRFGDKTVAASQTTPEAPEFQRLLKRAVDEGFASVVAEVSSHALELRRVGSVAFDVGVFTNLSQDHLNFHSDMQQYLRAKGQLFEELGRHGKAGTAVVNRDDASAPYIIQVNRGCLLTYAVDTDADVRAHSIQSDLAGTRFAVTTPIGRLQIELPHLGEFHVHNALAAVSVGVALGVDGDTIVRGLADTPAVPGRFELVDEGQNFRVAVDYAHKPAALERLLDSARRLQPARILTVFGCGGDRDRGKRPLMGEIAARRSDLVIVTSDNPRSESPERIIDEILEGVAGGKAKVVVEPDRERAITLAIAEAGPGDIVLIAGKGHETYQLFDDRRVDFDDREVARLAIRRRLGAPL